MAYGLGQGVERGNIMKYIMPAVVIILLIGIIVGAFYLFSSGAKRCSDKECFVEVANECEDVVLERDEEGSTFKYEAKDCVLTKTAVKLSEDEPDEMKDYLEGKSLVCEYTLGDFSENWIDTLSVGLDYCEGELKDALEELAAGI